VSREIVPGLVSVVIPALNEEESVPALVAGIRTACEAIGRAFEVVVVDDGSTDGTFDRLRELRAADPRVRAVRFRGNFGKAAALSAGFQAVRGEVVLTMDADLQDDPTEIPRFLAKLDEGCDLVSGWKAVRNDPPGKTLPSKLFNAVTARLTGIPLHDFNSGFKAYRRELIDEIEVYGELHRYIPVLAAQKRFRIGEIAVRHHARRFGRSKYGVERFTRGLLDLLTILFLTKYIRRPSHLFGTGGLAFMGAGLAISLYMSALWLLGERPIGNRPLLLLGVLLLIVGVQFVSMGLIGELILRQTRPTAETFSIRETLG
jgi:glycosyltransferase involved in cell wall biosynthesis